LRPGDGGIGPFFEQDALDARAGGEFDNVFFRVAGILGQDVADGFVA